MTKTTDKPVYLTTDLLSKGWQLFIDLSRHDPSALLALGEPVPKGVVLDVSQAPHRVAQVGCPTMPRARVPYDCRSWDAKQNWFMPLGGLFYEDAVLNLQGRKQSNSESMIAFFTRFNALQAPKTERFWIHENSVEFHIQVYDLAACTSQPI